MSLLVVSLSYLALYNFNLTYSKFRSSDNFFIDKFFLYNSSYTVCLMYAIIALREIKFR